MTAHWRAAASPATTAARLSSVVGRERAGAPKPGKSKNTRSKLSARGVDASFANMLELSPNPATNIMLGLSLIDRVAMSLSCCNGGGVALGGCLGSVEQQDTAPQEAKWMVPDDNRNWFGPLRHSAD